MQKGTYPSHVDPCLAEVFSIGLTILSSGTLEDCDSVYRHSPYDIKKDKLNILLRSFKQKYSDFLYTTIAGMVAVNPQDRKKCSVIASTLVQYEAQILDLEPFTANNQSYRPSQRVSTGVPRASGPSDTIYRQPQPPNPLNYRPQETQGMNPPPYLSYQQQQVYYPVGPYSNHPQSQSHQGPIYQQHIRPY